MRTITGEIRHVAGYGQTGDDRLCPGDEAPAELVIECAERGRLPVVNFSAGGIATPSRCRNDDALGADGVFVGSGIFKSSSPERMAKAIVEAVNNFNEPKVICKGQPGSWRCDAGPRYPYTPRR